MVLWISVTPGFKSRTRVGMCAYIFQHRITYSRLAIIVTIPWLQSYRHGTVSKLNVRTLSEELASSFFRSNEEANFSKILVRSD